MFNMLINISKVVGFVTPISRPIPSPTADFGISCDDLSSIVCNKIKLSKFGDLQGVARCLRISLEKGVSAYDRPPIAERKRCYGSNRYNADTAKSVWTFVWEALQVKTLIVLIICALVSMCLGVSIEGWPKSVYVGLAFMLSVFMVIIITAVCDYNFLVRDLTTERKIPVTRDGEKKSISIYDLVVGDIVHLCIRDQVPADGLFISGCILLIDESCLTGDSKPVYVCREMPHLRSGSIVQDGSCMMLVTSVGMNTAWGQMMGSASQQGEDETPLQIKLNYVATNVEWIGKAFSLLVLVFLTVWFLVKKALHDDFLEWSSRDVLLELLNYIGLAVTIFMSAVPIGLPLAVTWSRSFAMRKLMNERVRVRHPSACEMMSSVSCICIDKTGTLTTNHMVVNRIWICDEVVGDSGSTCVLKPVNSEAVLQILLQSIFNNTSAVMVDGENGKKTIMGSPTESALLEYGLLLGEGCDSQYREAKMVEAVPFNSVRKMMSVLLALPAGGMRAICKGSPEIILDMCEKFVESNGESVHLSREKKKCIMDIANGFSTEGLRTLCFAYQDITDACSKNRIPDTGYTLVAVVGISNPVRPGVKEVVQACLSDGIDVRMVTGDNMNTAKAVARECGILTENSFAIGGPDFRDRTSEGLEELRPKIEVMARFNPSDKQKAVNQLKNKFIVAMIGDGANDVPALHEADIGLAMGIAGTEVAKENGNIVILDDNFTSIVILLKWGRAVYLNVQKFLHFQLTLNIVALMLNVVSACISGSALLTLFQLLWVNLIIDVLGAFALATEPPREILMKRPPVGRDMNLITSSMRRNVFGQSVYQLAVLLVLKFNGESLLRLDGSDAASVLNTFIFNSFVFCQVFNEINSREAEKLNVFRGISKSWLLLTVTIFIVAFQVVIVELLGFWAGTVPLSWHLWLLSVLIGSLSLLLAVVLKCIKPAKHEDGSCILES